MRQAVARAVKLHETDLAARLALSEERIAYMDGHERKRTSALLCLGSVFGLLGFLFAFIIGVLKFSDPMDYEGHVFPSGRGYFPPTVSEMVHDPRDPAGKAFFAFEFLAALFIFISWYPWELANVYTGDDDEAICGVSWVMLRQFVPAPGMMLVACVTTTPFAQATVLDWFTIGIHIAGAFMMFFGYFMVEGKTLGWGFFSQPKGAVRLRQTERVVRVLCLNGVCFWYAAFFAIQIFLCVPNIPICCSDTWSRPVAAEPGESLMHNVQLVDTATGTFLKLKVASYLSEVLCGLCLICSHLAIWYFCEERHIDLAEELADVGAGYRRLEEAS